MAKIFIIGAGNFGTALGKVLSSNNDVIIYSIEKDVVEEINSRHVNSKYLPGIKLSFPATMDVSLSRGYDVILLAVPSKANEIVCKNFPYNGQIIVCTSKGLTINGHVPTDVVERTLKAPSSKVAAISGPSIATELAQGLPTEVMIGGSKSTAKALKKMF